MFIVRPQRQVHCRFVDDSVSQKIRQTRKTTASDEAGGFKSLDPTPVVIDKSYNLVTQFGMFRDLFSEFNGAVVCTHDQQEPSVSAPTPQKWQE